MIILANSQMVAILPIKEIVYESVVPNSGIRQIFDIFLTAMRSSLNIVIVLLKI
jgi:hypothetical protein